MFDEARRVPAGGHELAAYVRGEGPAVVFLPGAFDLAASFREVVPPLSRAGHRVVAFDLPGHGASATWGRARLPARELADALDEALEALGVTRALVVGHDLGARIGRELAARHPGRVRGLVSIGMVLTGRMPVDPARLFREALGPRFFLLAIQEPGAVEPLLARDVARTLAFFHRGAGPASTPFEGTRYALFDELASFRPEAPAGKILHDEPWFSRYVDAFERTGFDDALAMLRPITENWRDEAERPERLEVPVTFILGERDALVPPERAEGLGSSECFPKCAVEIVAGVGHYPHLENAPEVSALLLSLAKDPS